MTSELASSVLTLLATAVATGLSLYSALATPGVLAYLGLIELPDPLAGLATPQVWGTLLVLALVEASIARFRLADIVWNALHTLARPLAAMLVVSASLTQTTGLPLWAAAVSGALLAFAVHVYILAVHTASRTAGPKPQRSGFTVTQLAAASLLSVLAHLAPPIAGICAVALLLGPLPWLPRLWGAAWLAPRALAAALARAGRSAAWDHGAESLPLWALKTLERELGTPLGPLRSAPATLGRLGTAWPYYRGRLLLPHGRPPLFIYRSALRPRLVRLQQGAGMSDEYALIETLRLDSSPHYAICLTPAAPPGPAILAGLAGTG